MSRALPRTKAAITALRKVYEETGVPRNRGTVELSEPDFYDYDVFRRTVAVTGTFDRLAEVQMFLGQLPPTEYFRDQKLSPERWVQHHYAYHVVLVASLPDLLYLLVNSVLRIGLAERHCTSDIVQGNHQVKMSGFADDLKAVEVAAQNHREKRNRYLHRGENIDIGEDIGSDFYDVLTTLAFTDSLADERIAEAELLDQAFREELEEHVFPKMESERTELAKPVLQLFSKLDSIYRATSAALA